MKESTGFKIVGLAEKITELKHYFKFYEERKNSSDGEKLRKILQSAVLLLNQLIEMIVSEKDVRKEIEPDEIKTIKDLFNAYIAVLQDVHAKTPHHLSDETKSYLASLASTVQVLSRVGFTPILFVGNSKQVLSTREDLQKFLEKFLDEEATIARAQRYDARPKKLESQALKISLSEVLGTIRASLDSSTLLKEAVWNVLDNVWNELIAYAPPELIALFCTHPKTFDILKERPESMTRDDPLFIRLAARAYWADRASKKRCDKEFSKRVLRALSVICTSRYFLLTSGQNDLVRAINYVDGHVRESLPPYKIVLFEREPLEEEMGEFVVYLYAVGNEICYKAKEYDGIISTGTVNKVAAYPHIEVLPPQKFSEDEFFHRPRAVLNPQTLYLFAGVTRKYVYVAWQNAEGKVFTQSLYRTDTLKEQEQTSRWFERLNNPKPIPFLDDEKREIFSSGIFLRETLGEYGTVKLLADLQHKNCSRSLTAQEDFIVRRNLKKYRAPSADENPAEPGPVPIDELNCIADLKARQLAIEGFNRNILEWVYSSVNVALINVKPDSNIEFRLDLQNCKASLKEMYECNDRRPDQKIRGIVTTLVDTRNKIRSTSEGRSVSLFGFSVGGSDIAAGIDSVIQHLQKSFDDYPNYMFTLDKAKGAQLWKTRWTEQFADAPLELTSGEAQVTKPVRRLSRSSSSSE